MAPQAILDEKVDEGIAGPNHQKFVGKLVFHIIELRRDRMNAPNTGFKTEFNFGRPLI